MLFACNDAVAKYLNNHMPTVQVVWARYMAAFVLALFLSNPIMRPSIMRTSRPWLQLGRSTLLLVSTALNFFALRYLQLDQAIAIIFCTPFIVAALGGPILGEWIKWRRWTAIMVGFCGVLLVTRPGAGGIHPAALLSFGGSDLLCDLLDLDAHPLAHATATRPPTSIPTWWARSWSPSRCRSSGRRKAIRLVIVLMCSMGLFSGLGHYLLIVGHRLAPASVLAPFIYTEIVWMIGLGYLVFGDVPNSWTLSGVAVVIASGLYLLYRERVVGPRRRRSIDFARLISPAPLLQT